LGHPRPRAKFSLYMGVLDIGSYTVASSQVSY
jgi:hypothetical protein